MIIPDVNLLLYAHNAAQQDHAFYRDWLEDLVAKRQLALSTLAMLAFVRIATLPAYRPAPLASDQAIAALDDLRRQSGVRLLHPGPQHWDRTVALINGARASGKVVSDAQHAAIALEHDGEFASADTDFKRFTKLGLRFHLIQAAG